MRPRTVEVGGKEVLGRGGSKLRAPRQERAKCIPGAGRGQEGRAWGGREAEWSRDRGWRAVQGPAGLGFGSDGGDRSTCSVGPPDCWLGKRLGTGVDTRSGRRLCKAAGARGQQDGATPKAAVGLV